MRTGSRRSGHMPAYGSPMIGGARPRSWRGAGIAAGGQSCCGGPMVGRTGGPTIRSTCSVLSSAWADRPALISSERISSRFCVDVLAGPPRYCRRMTPQELANLAQLRAARDLMDRDYARPLDVPTMARHALMSPAHFSRRFRAAYGETPYSYLMTRRIERAMALLRERISRHGRLLRRRLHLARLVQLPLHRARRARHPAFIGAREHRAVLAMPSCLAKLRNAASARGAPATEQDSRSDRGRGLLALIAWTSR